MLRIDLPFTAEAETGSARIIRVIMDMELADVNFFGEVWELVRGNHRKTDIGQVCS